VDEEDEEDGAPVAPLPEAPAPPVPAIAAANAFRPAFVPPMSMDALREWLRLLEFDRDPERTWV